VKTACGYGGSSESARGTGAGLPIHLRVRRVNQQTFGLGGVDLRRTYQHEGHRGREPGIGGADARYLLKKEHDSISPEKVEEGADRFGEKRW